LRQSLDDAGSLSSFAHDETRIIVLERGLATRSFEDRVQKGLISPVSSTIGAIEQSSSEQEAGNVVVDENVIVLVLSFQ
jgi:hypothetical protein